MKLSLILILSLTCCAGAQAEETAAVLGYENASDYPLWQETQIGFGLKNLLAQALQDKTAYVLIDEKIDFGISHENLEAQLQQQWLLKEQQVTAETLKALAQKYRLGHFFWAKVIDFTTLNNHVSFAFFNSSEYQDVLKLQVCHYRLTSNRISCAEGEGRQSRTLNGVIYSPSDKISFKESGAGRLSKQAIDLSLEKLLQDEN